MTITQDKAFEKQLEREINTAYLARESLRSTVVKFNGVKGCQAVFQKTNNMAQTKSIEGMVPVLNLDHKTEAFYLEPTVFDEEVEGLEQMKMDFDKRMDFAESIASLFIKKTHSQIIEILSFCKTNIIHASNEGMTKDKAVTAYEMFESFDIPDDGQRFALVGWKQWSDLLQIPQFAMADYDGKAKVWLGTRWLPTYGLPMNSEGVRVCYFYHKKQIGHAIDEGVELQIGKFINEKRSNPVRGEMSQGAGLIDEQQIIAIECQEN